MRSSFNILISFKFPIKKVLSLLNEITSSIRHLIRKILVLNILREIKIVWIVDLVINFSKLSRRRSQIDLASLRVSSSSIIFIVVDWRMHCRYRLLESLAILVHLFSWLIKVILRRTVWVITPKVYISKVICISVTLDLVCNWTFRTVVQVIALVNWTFPSQRLRMILILLLPFVGRGNERCPVVHVSLIHCVFNKR